MPFPGSALAIRFQALRSHASGQTAAGAGQPLRYHCSHDAHDTEGTYESLMRKSFTPTRSQWGNPNGLTRSAKPLVQTVFTSLDIGKQTHILDYDICHNMLWHKYTAMYIMLWVMQHPISMLPI